MWNELIMYPYSTFSSSICIHGNITILKWLFIHHNHPAIEVHTSMETTIYGNPHMKQVGLYTLYISIIYIYVCIWHQYTTIHISIEVIYTIGVSALSWLCIFWGHVAVRLTSISVMDQYNVGPSSYKMVYKPHENYSYTYHMPS